jgi:hypothetical protein
MSRLAMIPVTSMTLCMLAACGSGHKQPQTAGTGSGSAGPALYAQKVIVGWGFQKAAATTDVFLQTTDETGKQVSYPLGTFQGECKQTKPAPEMRALTGVACTGIELHAVVQDQEIVILKMRVDGGKPDPMAREEVTRVKEPGGASIEAAL